MKKTTETGILAFALIVILYLFVQAYNSPLVQVDEPEPSKVYGIVDGDDDDP